MHSKAPGFEFLAVLIGWPSCTGTWLSFARPLQHCKPAGVGVGWWWPHPSSRGCTYSQDMVSTGLSSLCWAFWLMSSLLGPSNFLGSWYLGLSSGYPQFPLSHCYVPPFKFFTLCTFPSPPPPSDPAPFSLPLFSPYQIPPTLHLL